MAKMDSIILVLVIVASKQWEVHHMDVKSVFLHGDLKEEYHSLLKNDTWELVNLSPGRKIVK